MSGRGGGWNNNNNTNTTNNTNNINSSMVDRRGSNGDTRGGGGGYHRYNSNHNDDRGGYNHHHHHPPPRDYRGGGRFGGGYHNNGPPPPVPQSSMRGGGGGDGRGGGGDGRGGGGGYMNSGGSGSGPPPLLPPRRKLPPHVITFNSYEEEMDWIEGRRRKRLARTSRFDVTPEQLGIPLLPPLLSQQQQLPYDAQQQQHQHSLQQLDPAAIATAAAAALMTAPPHDGNSGALSSSSLGLPQQTRHARRLYVGNLPMGVTEQQIHDAFHNAILLTLQPGSGLPDPAIEDPILSVYINQERRFSFVEFKSVELCSACMALDGLEVVPGQPTVKVKRPNDYIPTMAPMEHWKPVLDLSKIGIISSAVLDGPNKIFIGGLHYHLQDNQVVELLQAFGKVKSFHLVKNEPESMLSKGYCFVEYVDPAVTPIAVAGLNGMDIGGGKSLTARLAGERAGMISTTMMPMPTDASATATDAGGQPSIQDKTIVSGYDVEALVDAAMGKSAMPQAPSYFDAYGQPVTRIFPIIPMPGVVLPTSTAVAPALVTMPGMLYQPPMYQQFSNLPPPVVGLQQGVGSNLGLPPALPPIVETPPTPPETRILVLLNMVSDDDLATDDDYNGLVEEVREECAKHGTLIHVQIPRYVSATVEASAIRKVYLSYAFVADAVRAQQELSGRQFGPNVVETLFYSEADFAAGIFR
jgi:RNA recognition motif-containing protein